MSWLKLGRWVLFYAVGVCGAAACGGRGNLAGTDGGNGDPDTNPFGGALATGGAGASGAPGTAGRARGGTPSVGGAPAKGGVGGVATSGSSGSLGVGGAGLCVPGQGMCTGASIATCNDSGNGYELKACGKGQSCVERGDVAQCVTQSCVPGQVICDASNRFVQVCLADGISAVTKLDCTAQGQLCSGGLCKSPICQPNQLFCDKTGVRLCTPDGATSGAWENCAAGEFCDPQALACKGGLCAPNQPACNGSVATTCNQNGSGFLGGGVDCAVQPDQQCSNGSCVCLAGFIDCDGDPKNGCEVNAMFDMDNCGGCGLVCSGAHMPMRICAGVCSGACEIGYQDCNGDKLKDGCETDVVADVKNCGGCGLSCSANHVAQSCVAGACDGACAAGFVDCNKNKQSDGCESDPTSDIRNCGGCGVLCSKNHVAQACAAGVCSGACTAGFADCDSNKQSNGCEINTQTDVKNCGACGSVCPAGQACSAGKCSALYTFSGVAQNLKLASLTGWSQCFVEDYNLRSTPIANVQKACTGSLLMLACRAKGSATLQLAAYAPRADVLFATGTGNVPHDANGVGWYFSGSQSWGFAPAGDPISRSSCDIQASSLDPSGIDGEKRLCWHTAENVLQGGWRCGADDDLNDTATHERLVLQAQ